MSPAKMEEPTRGTPGACALRGAQVQDGSTVFMDFAGGVYRLDLTTGTSMVQ